MCNDEKVIYSYATSEYLAWISKVSKRFIVKTNQINLVNKAIMIQHLLCQEADEISAESETFTYLIPSTDSLLIQLVKYKCNDVRMLSMITKCSLRLWTCQVDKVEKDWKEERY